MPDLTSENVNQIQSKASAEYVGNGNGTHCLPSPKYNLQNNSNSLNGSSIDAGMNISGKTNFPQIPSMLDTNSPGAEGANLLSFGNDAKSMLEFYKGNKNYSSHPAFKALGYGTAAISGYKSVKEFSNGNNYEGSKSGLDAVWGLASAALGPIAAAGAAGNYVGSKFESMIPDDMNIFDSPIDIVHLQREKLNKQRIRENKANGLTTPPNPFLK